MATELSFDDKVLLTNEVVKIVNQHWIRCEGELHNDKKFWDSTLHSLNNQDWEDMMSVMTAIQAMDPSLVSYDARICFEQVKHVLMTETHKDNPQALDARKHKKISFKALMNIKDIMNDLSGYKQPTKFPKRSEPTKFEEHFSIGD